MWISPRAAAAADERSLTDPIGGRLLLAGDRHRNSAWARKTLDLAARHGVATVLQLGDFGIPRGKRSSHLSKPRYARREGIVGAGQSMAPLEVSTV
jgi:hypothetical protein